MTITLDNLPTEVLLVIASQSDYDTDIGIPATQYGFASLALTNRRLHDIFNPILWRYNGKHGTHKKGGFSIISAVCWAAPRNRVDILEIAIKYHHHLGSFLENDPIHLAAKHGHDAVVSWLIDHEVPVECTPCERIDVDSPFLVPPWPQDHVSPTYSALHTALISGQESTSILLLSRGAKYQFKADTNNSAIHLAAIHGLPAVIKYLVNHMGINVDQEDQHGVTPLYYAVERRHNMKTIQALLDLGADKNAERRHESPLIISLKRGHFSNAITLLDARARVNPTENHHEAPLVVCARESSRFAEDIESSCQYEVLRLIIANGAPIDKSFNGDTALCSAIESGTTLAVYNLLRAGADVQIPRAKDDMTPFDVLWICLDSMLPSGHTRNIMKHVTSKARLLIAAGVRLDIRRDNNSSLLENALVYCHTNQEYWAFEEILSLVTCLNVCDRHINELFERCLEEQWLMSARILMRYGAVSRATNKLAFIWAKQIIERGDIDSHDYTDFSTIEFRFCLDFLSIQQVESLFHISLELRGNEERRQILIDRGALSSWEKTKNFKPWLHHAASRGSVRLVQRLVRSGMDINALDEEYKTPLMVALERDMLFMVDLLFKLGANPFYPYPDTECRKRPTTSKEILSPFELAIRRDCLPHIQKWWLHTPPEARPTEEDIHIPCVLRIGPQYQTYLRHLRYKTDNILDECMDSETGLIERFDLRKSEDNERKAADLVVAINMDGHRFDLI
ncbi:ankyrin [Annulohypoxylon moriforme]|nr:ankyrin [Annulohypoxylon moriforme]